MSQANSVERQMLELINQERAAVGVDPLQLELRLNESSEDYSKLMLQEDFFSHTGPDNSSPRARMEDAGFVFSGSWSSGENIAWQSERGAAGLADDVVNLHNSLMNSSGHRANILNPNFEVIGIGIENGDYNGWDAVMVTQNFASTDAQVQIDGGSGNNPPPSPSDDIVRIGDGGSDRLTYFLGREETIKLGVTAAQISSKEVTATIHCGAAKVMTKFEAARKKMCSMAVTATTGSGGAMVRIS
jgi:serralysin